MKAEFRKSFSRDLKRRKRDKLFLNNVREIIEEVERTKNINEVKNLKHLKGDIGCPLSYRK